MIDAAERRRVAVHEAGHAAASVLLGLRGQGPISCVPAAAYGGVCFVGSPRRPTAADLDGLGRPGPLQPARVRRFLECSVMVHLAGGVIALLYAGAASWLLHKPVEAQRIVVDVAAWYWHFMALLWIYILVLLIIVR